MPLAYDHYYYNNQRLLRAEEKILALYRENPYGQYSMEFFQKLTGENKRAVERMLSSIRKYPGYTVTFSKKTGLTLYQIRYEPAKDPWAYLVN